MKNDIQDRVTGILTNGGGTRETAALLGLDYDKAHDAVLLPGYIAADAVGQMEYPEACSGEDAAEEFAAAYDAENKTTWVSLATWRVGLTVDEDGDVEDVRVEQESHTITLEPTEPECSGAAEHDWREIETIGSGGGVIVTEKCRHCGTVKTTNTWDTNMATGEEGMLSIEYTAPGRIDDDQN